MSDVEQVDGQPIVADPCRIPHHTGIPYTLAVLAFAPIYLRIGGER